MLKHGGGLNWGTGGFASSDHEQHVVIDESIHFNNELVYSVNIQVHI